MKKLSDFAEQISDDFKSTFSVVDENTLQNLLSPRDFEPLTKIIQNYIPDCKLEFIKLDMISSEYDCYLIRMKEDDNEWQASN